MMPYEYTVIGIQQRREQLQDEAEHQRLMRFIRRQGQTGHRMGTILIQTGSLLIRAGKRLQRSEPAAQSTVRTRYTSATETPNNIPKHTGGTARGLSAGVRLDK